MLCATTDQVISKQVRLFVIFFFFFFSFACLCFVIVVLCVLKCVCHYESGNRLLFATTKLVLFLCVANNKMLQII
jgi:hypothetical protein